MDNDIAVVEQDPTSIGCTLNARFAIELAVECLVNRIENSLELPIALARADHKIIRDVVELLQIQHHDIAGLLVLSNFHCPPRKCRRFDGLSPIRVMFSSI